jgi:alpha-L-fucosidase 2
MPTSIQTHPAGARKYVGACHVLSVGLAFPENSTSISYQWYKDDVEVDGETGPRLILSDIQTDDAGTYKVVVTADGNELTSNPAVLVVPGLNLALAGTATQSTTAFGGSPERGIDGNTSGNWGNGSVTHSDNVAGTSWQVQLYDVSSVEKVVIWGRTDCCMNRLTDFRVSALDNDGVEIVGQDFFTDKTYPDTTTTGFEIALPVAVECRTVKIARLGADAGGLNYLSLAEVEVFATLAQ